MIKSTLRVLSPCAGVQSMMITLTACDGALRAVNAAIFADAGWEPPAVYEQVDRIDPELNRVGIPLYRVNSGNLRLCSLWRWDAGPPRRMRVAVRVYEGVADWRRLRSSDSRSGVSASCRCRDVAVTRDAMESHDYLKGGGLPVHDASSLRRGGEAAS